MKSEELRIAVRVMYLNGNFVFSQLSILNSSFSILHSPFFTLNSSLEEKGEFSISIEGLSAPAPDLLFCLETKD